MYTKQALRELGVTGALTQPHREPLDERGFFVAEGALSDAQCAAMCEEFDRLCAQEGDRGGHEVHIEPTARRVSNIFNKSDDFDPCMEIAPLLLASETGDVPLMRLLVELGADHQLKNVENCTPLLAASGVGVLGNGDESAGTEEDAIAAGKKIYKRYCRACHLPDGTGRIGPNLVDGKWKYERTGNDVGKFEIIYAGGAGAMQAFGRRMDQDDILKVMAYLEVLAQK